MISTRSALFTFRDEFGSGCQKGRSQRGVGGERSEIKTSPHGPYKKARRDAKRGVVWSRVGSWVSLESGVCSR